MARADEVENLTPEQVAAGLRAGRMLLVDVREPNETSVESYPGCGDRAVVALRSVRRSLIRRASRWSLPAARDGVRSRRRSLRRTRAIPTNRTSPAASSHGRPRAFRPRAEAGSEVPHAPCNYHRRIGRGCCRNSRRRAGARRQCLTIGRTTSTRRCLRTSPRTPASRFATTPSTPMKRWKPSCWPASRVTTSWCRPAISCSARSRPTFSRSLTRASCRTS